jgi:hypothetical protein
MQSGLTICKEVTYLAARNDHAGVDIILSRDTWNPVATVCVRGLRLPAAVKPAESDVYIPVPNLYGFADFAVRIALLPSPVLERGKDRPVPFCRKIDEEDVQKHQEYYVSLRERSGWPYQPYFLCLTPPVNPPGELARWSLSGFIDVFLAYLVDPETSVRSELQQRELEWDSGRNPWLLTRIGHLWEGLEDYPRAAEVYRRGLGLFPGQPEFGDLLRRVSSRMG